jgi:beta-galactosidase
MLSGYAKGEVVMNSTKYNWNNWADLLQPETSTEVIANYDNQFYKGKAAVVQRKLGNGTVTYIGVDTDDAKLEKDILRNIYTKAGATTENYPEGIYVYWRDGFYVAVNYSSDDYTMELSGLARVLVGEKVLKPAGVLVWTEE